MSVARLKTLLDRAVTEGRALVAGAEVDPRQASAVAWKAALAWEKSTLFSPPSGWPDWVVASHLFHSRRALIDLLEVDEGCTSVLLARRLARWSQQPQPCSSPAFDVDEPFPDMRQLPLFYQTVGWEAPEWCGIAVCEGRVGLVRGRVDGCNLSLIDLPPAFRSLVSDGQQPPCVLIGGAHPAFYLVAALALGMPEIGLGAAAALIGRDAAIALVEGQHVPGDAEYVLRGILRGSSPSVFEPARLLRSRQPVHFALSCHDGASEMANLLCLATEILLARHLANVEGGLDVIDVRVDLRIGPTMAFIKMRGLVMGQTRTALMAALSSAAYWVRSVILVDEDVRVDDLTDVFWSISSRVDLGADLLLLPGMPMVDGDLFEQGRRWMADGGTGLRWGIDSCIAPTSMPGEREAFRRAVPHNYPAVAAMEGWP